MRSRSIKRRCGSTPISGGAPQPGTCLYVDARPSAGRDRGVPESDRGVPDGGAERTQFVGGAFQSGTCLRPNPRPGGRRHCGIPDRPADEARFRAWPTSNWETPSTRWAGCRKPIAEYQASLSIDPDVAEVHYELAYALAQIPGRVPEAIAECQKMLLLKPGDEPGRQLMASLLAFQNGRGR